jgi:hypothetical protein
MSPIIARCPILRLRQMSYVACAIAAPGVRATVAAFAPPRKGARMGRILARRLTAFAGPAFPVKALAHDDDSPEDVQAGSGAPRIP